jgi:hypothetical protein
MNKTGYALIGWVVVKIAERVARRKLQQNRGKIAAAGVVLLVVVAGIAAAAAEGEDD